MKSVTPVEVAAPFCVGLVLCLLILFAAAGRAGDVPPDMNLPDAPPFYSDEPACKVKSVQKLQSAIENGGYSAAGNFTAKTELDIRGVYQVYVAKARSNDYRCISCVQRLGGPALDRNKPMLTIHPSGQWFVVGIEEDHHDLAWWPTAWQRGLLQSGVWLNMWVTTPTGDRWYPIIDFKNGHGDSAPANGFVGTPFTPDGRKAAWAEIVDGNVLAHHNGVWRLYLADFVIRPDGTPTLANQKDITPKGARWLEPGNFSPDGRHLLLSTDIGLSDAWGQDQWSLDIMTGQLQPLTHTPAIWDEHGLYSPDGRKISFMSSYPYRKEPGSYKPGNLKTEIMLMNADGSHLQQITHFNVPGYSESQPGKTIAALAAFLPGDGSTMFASAMSPDSKFSKTNWAITFEGHCGNR